MGGLTLKDIFLVAWSILKGIFFIPQKISKWYKKNYPKEYDCELSKINLRELKGGLIKMIFDKRTYVITQATLSYFSQFREILRASIDQNVNNPTDNIEGEDISNKKSITKENNSQTVLTKESMIDIFKNFHVFDEKKRILYFKKILFNDIDKRLRKRSLNICIKYSDDGLSWINSFTDLDVDSFNAKGFEINISVQR